MIEKIQYPVGTLVEFVGHNTLTSYGSIGVVVAVDANIQSYPYKVFTLRKGIVDLNLDWAIYRIFYVPIQ